jgi:hypothetical protein
MPRIAPGARERPGGTDRPAILSFTMERDEMNSRENRCIRQLNLTHPDVSYQE